MKLILYSGLLFLVTVTFLACGGAETSDTEPATSSDAMSELSVDSNSLEITIRPVGEQMLYDTDSISVAAGTDVTLILENTATLPTMIHNVVILTTDSDEDVNRVGIAAITAGEAQGYLPEDDAIFVATPMAQPGETVRVSFTAPSEPGVHRFICTYPGHYALMQGILIIT